MSTALYGVIEIVIFFGGILAFCVWQIRSLRRSREEDARRAAEGRPPASEDPDAEPSREDIFWREMTRPKARRR